MLLSLVFITFLFLFTFHPLLVQTVRPLCNSINRTMAEDLVEHEAADILQRLKANPKVGIKNPEEVLRKLNVLIGGGFDKLLVNKLKSIH